MTVFDPQAREFQTASHHKRSRAEVRWAVLRKIATGVLVLCLTAWVGLALNLCIAVAGQGFSGIAPKLLHLAGNTG